MPRSRRASAGDHPVSAGWQGPAGLRMRSFAVVVLGLILVPGHGEGELWRLSVSGSW